MMRYVAVVAHVTDFRESFEVKESYPPEVPHIQLTTLRNSADLRLVQV